MDKIFTGPGLGKTRLLIQKSHLTGATIVCLSHEECDRIQRLADELGLHITFPISFDEFINRKYYAKRIDGFLIDNAEMLLQELTPVKIKAITITI